MGSPSLPPHPNNHIFVICYLTIVCLALCVQGTEEARDLDSLSRVPVLTRPALGEYGRMLACLSRQADRAVHQTSANTGQNSSFALRLSINKAQVSFLGL